MARIGYAQKSETEAVIFAKVAEVHGSKKVYADVIGVDNSYIASKFRAIAKQISGFNELLSSLNLEFKLVSKDEKNVLGLTDDEQHEMIELLKKIEK